MDEQDDLTNLDLTDTGLYGEYVLIVRNLGHGVIEREWLPAGLAVENLMHNPENGTAIKRAHICWFEVLDKWAFSP